MVLFHHFKNYRKEALTVDKTIKLIVQKLLKNSCSRAREQLTAYIKYMEYKCDKNAIFKDEEVEDLHADFRLDDLHNVLKLLKKDGHDIIGLGIYEIPDPSLYCFYSETENKAFNIHINKNIATACYFGEDNVNYFTGSVTEAVQKYKEWFTLWDNEN